MTSRRYENFDLLVESLADGTHRSRVTTSPVGAGASATFAMPFDATELENLLLKLDPGRSQMRRAPGSQSGIRSRVSNNRYVSDHTPNDGGYRRYWELLTLGS